MFTKQIQYQYQAMANECKYLNNVLLFSFAGKHTEAGVHGREREMNRV